MFHRFLRASLLALTVCATAHAAPRIDPVPGGIAEVTVAPASEPRPKVLFAEHPTLVTTGPEGWRALVGLPLDLAAGQQQVLVIHGDGHQSTLAFNVRAKDYPQQQLQIKDDNMVEPDAATLARIEAEQRAQDEAKAQWREEPGVDLELLVPASGRLTSRFGLRRVINGQPRAPHRGIDLAVPVGTPVRAPSFGIVTQVGDYLDRKSVV